METTSNQITLGDGRTLGFAEYGRPKGRPIMYFHGWPSSRLETRMLGSAARKLNIRVLAPDRPGFGLSDYKPGRRLEDWPNDVIELADALGPDRFSIMGAIGWWAICGHMYPEDPPAFTGCRNY